MRKYDFTCENPFTAQDIVALTPILKHVMYTSADGRSLLESAKTSLDKVCRYMNLKKTFPLAVC